jgi:hypothetical protein
MGASTHSGFKARGKHFRRFPSGNGRYMLEIRRGVKGNANVFSSLECF